MSRRLTLFLPGLFGPPVPDGVVPPGESAVGLPAMPVLLRMLSRADREACPSGRLRGLFAYFGFDRSDAVMDADLPVAAVGWLAESGLRQRPPVLRADPVCLQADMGCLRLLDRCEWALTLDEAHRLAAEINDVFAEDGWLLQVASAQRWYLSVPEVPDIQTHEPDAAIGSNIDPFLPGGPDAGIWHRHMNEVQMILNQSPVNSERKARGQSPINSLWFWGAGALPEAHSHDIAVCHGRDTVLAGLATLQGIPLHTMPDSAQQWLVRDDDRGGEAGHTLMLPDAIGPALLADLERHWFAPLLAAVRQRSLTELVIDFGAGQRYRVDRNGLGRWWRRRRELSHYVTPQE